MRKIFMSMMTFNLIVSAVFLSSCSKDDDGNDELSSGIVSCYSNVDGQRDDYSFGYWMFEDTDGGEICIHFSDINLLNYASFNDKTLMQDFIIYIRSNIDEIPLGEISCDKYEIELTRKHSLYHADDEMFQWYWLYADPKDSPNKASLFIEKTGANTYKMRLDNAIFYASDENDGIDQYSRQTKGSFYFEGSLLHYQMSDFE